MSTCKVAAKARRRQPRLTSEKRTHTHRGFRLIRFVDRNGEKCSVQKSSSAMDHCIWLGCEGRLMQLVQNEGWKDVPLTPGFQIVDRMHLTREDVVALLPILEHFVKTGELP